MGGFESGDDFVAARVTIDVPTEGIAGLREITQEMDRFRTSVESANRSSETFTSYLQRIAEAANQAATATQNMVQMLERNIDYQNRAVTAGAGGPVPQLNAPGQYATPWAPNTLGLGGGGVGSVPPYTPDVNTQLADLQSQNPRAYINKMAASGQYRMGDIAATSPTGMDIQNAATRIGQRAQLEQEGQVGPDGMSTIGSRAGRMGAVAQQVLNEISPGSSPLGIPGMIQRGLGGLSNIAGMAGMGRVAAIAAPMAGALGVGLAGYGLVQGAGGIYQDYKNMGLVRGGGAAEGVGYEMSIRAMAMNPFISGDQARQIVQQGLRDGYTGKEFDTVTQMVATNLKDFNIQIADSFALVRKNVIEGGQSMLGLASDLGVLKGIAGQGGYRSMPALVQDYKATSDALVSAGMSGTEAAQAALTGATMFSDNAILAGQGGPTMAAMMSPQNMAMLKYQGGVDVPAGLMPTAMPYAMSNEALESGSMNVLKRYAMMTWQAVGKPQRGTPSYYNAVSRWGMRAQMMNMPWAGEPQKVEEMFYQLISGKDPVGEATQKNQAEQKAQSQVQERSKASATAGSLVDAGSRVGGQIIDTLGQLGGTFADIFTNNDNIDDRWKDWAGRLGDRFLADNGTGSQYKIPMLENVRKTYGNRGFEILDASGQVQKLDQYNKEQMERLSSGELKVRRKGDSGSGYALQDLPNASGDNLKTIMGGKTEVAGQVTITLSPEAQKLLKVQGGNTVKLTPHEEQANRGYGQATPNNAPPGEDMPRGGR